MKKRLALVLAATMALSVFAMGCGSAEDTEETTKAAATQADTTAAQDETEADTTAAEEDTTEPAAEEGTTYDAEKIEINQFWEGGHTQSYAIADGQTLTMNFKATTFADATDNWDNWVLACTTQERTDAAYDGTKCESIILRADNFGWGLDYAAATLGITLNGGEMNWDSWLADAKAGMDVTLTVTRTGSDFVMSATTVAGANTYQYDVTWTSTAAVADTMYIFLTGETVTLDVTSAVVK